MYKVIKVWYLFPSICIFKLFINDLIINIKIRFCIMLFLIIVTFIVLMKFYVSFFNYFWSILIRWKDFLIIEWVNRVIGLKVSKQEQNSLLHVEYCYIPVQHVFSHFIQGILDENDFSQHFNLVTMDWLVLSMLSLVWKCWDMLKSCVTLFFLRNFLILEDVNAALWSLWIFSGICTLNTCFKQLI